MRPSSCACSRAHLYALCSNNLLSFGLIWVIDGSSTIDDCEGCAQIYHWLMHQLELCHMRQVSRVVFHAQIWASNHRASEWCDWLIDVIDASVRVVPHEASFQGSFSCWAQIWASNHRIAEWCDWVKLIDWCRLSDADWLMPIEWSRLSDADWVMPIEWSWLSEADWLMLIEWSRLSEAIEWCDWVKPIDWCNWVRLSSWVFALFCRNWTMK